MDRKITTAGALLIKSMLPTKASQDNFDLYKHLDKNKIRDLVNNLITHGGDKGPETINSLGKLFFNKATEQGFTTPLEDYNNDSEERQVLFSEFENKVADILKQDLPKQEQARQLGILSGHYSGRLSRENLAYMVSRGSTAAKMAQTGARGNPSQLQQGTASPLMAADVKGIPIPVAIKHSFAEGLSNAEHLAMSYGGRASTVMSQLSTEKPGALFKKLTPTVFHEVITTTDCGTKNGIPVPIKDTYSLLGRFESVTNHLIDEAYIHEKSGSGAKVIVARNPMTCQAKDGLCQKCYGLAASGHLPHIGQNMGVIASQSVSEVLTQAMLGTKHQGGVAGRQRNPYEKADNLLSNPENFQDEATIAEVNGKVEKMVKTSLGDHEVMINGVHHFIPNLQEPLVEVGSKVRLGDPISTGTLNPRKLVNLKGAGAGRIYLANKMREIYSQNTALDPRHFDVIARNMIKYYEVKDAGDSDFLPGDKVELSQVENYLGKTSQTVGLDQAENKTLAGRVLDLTPGTLLTRNHLDDLHDQGITKVPVSTSTLKINALVPGLQNLKLLDKNWVSKLSFNKLHKTIMEAAALGQKSDRHSTEPVASYLLGSEFGEGDAGKY